MSNKYSKFKKGFSPCLIGRQVMRRGFSLIELLVVLAIIAIMTGVIFVNKNSGKASRDVELATRQVAAQIRALQNEALNGKKIDTNGDGFGEEIACEFQFQVNWDPPGTASEYVITYHNCVGGGNIIPNPTINKVNLTKKRVTFPNSKTFYFNSPGGSIDSPQKITIQSTIDPTVENCIIISASGSVEEQKSACL